MRASSAGACGDALPSWGKFRGEGSRLTDGAIEACDRRVARNVLSLIDWMRRGSSTRGACVSRRVCR